MSPTSPRKATVRTSGVLAILAIVVLLIASVRVSSLAAVLEGAQRTYNLQFTDAAGISPGNPVRYAGIQVGSVASMSVQGTHAIVGIHRIAVSPDRVKQHSATAPNRLNRVGEP